MRRRLALCLASFGLMALPGPPVSISGPPPSQKFSWQTDVATARRLARSSDKPIFAVFR
jgi:hypothetical protein